MQQLKGWPTIAISKILESVLLGMRIAVYESFWSRVRNRRSHDNTSLKKQIEILQPQEKTITVNADMVAALLRRAAIMIKFTKLVNIGFS